MFDWVKRLFTPAPKEQPEVAEWRIKGDGVAYTTSKEILESKEGQRHIKATSNLFRATVKKGGSKDPNPRLVEANRKYKEESDKRFRDACHQGFSLNIEGTGPEQVIGFKHDKNNEAVTMGAVTPSMYKKIVELEKELEVYKALVKELAGSSIDFTVVSGEEGKLTLKVDTSRLTKVLDKVMAEHLENE